MGEEMGEEGDAQQRPPPLVWFQNRGCCSHDSRTGSREEAGLFGRGGHVQLPITSWWKMLAKMWLRTPRRDRERCEQPGMKTTVMFSKLELRDLLRLFVSLCQAFSFSADQTSNPTE